MTKHEATHILSQAYADVILAEKELEKDTPNRTVLMFHIRSIKAELENVVDKGIGLDLVKKPVGDPMM